MAKIYRLSDTAQQDYEEILRYIARDNVAAAERVRDKIEDALDKLAENPNIGHKRNDITAKHVRFWGVYSYQIVYDQDASPLLILRILSGYRDIGNMLDDDLLANENRRYYSPFPAAGALHRLVSASRRNSARAGSHARYRQGGDSQGRNSTAAQARPAGL